MSDPFWPMDYTLNDLIKEIEKQIYISKFYISMCVIYQANLLDEMLAKLQYNSVFIYTTLQTCFFLNVLK